MFRSIVFELHLVCPAGVDRIVLSVTTDPANPERSWRLMA